MLFVITYDICICMLFLACFIASVRVICAYMQFSSQKILLEQQPVMNPRLANTKLQEKSWNNTSFFVPIVNSVGGTNILKASKLIFYIFFKW